MIGIERFFLYRKFRKDMRKFTAVINNHPGWIMLPTVLEWDTQNLGTLFAKALLSAKNYNGLENRLQDLVGYTDEWLKRGLGWLSMSAIALAFHSYCVAKVNDFVVALEHEYGATNPVKSTVHIDFDG